MKKEKAKRHRAGVTTGEDVSKKDQKRKKLTRSIETVIPPDDQGEGELDASSDEDNESPADSSIQPQEEKSSVDKLPMEMPEWGIRLFELIQKEFWNVTKAVGSAEKAARKNSKSIEKIEKRLAGVELRNKELENENLDLKEQLLDIDFRQRRNNLIFEGITDSDAETDVQSIHKLRSILKNIPGLDQNFVIDKCHRIDGLFKPTRTRRVMCMLNWYVDVQLILRNRKHLPRGIYVSEDFPEEWVDRRKVLKPIYNAAKRNENLKHKTHLSRDKLVIDGRTYTAGPGCNICEINKILDVKSTCERSDTKTTVFLGLLSPYSNFHPANFQLANVQYNCAEQYIQSEKVRLFNDDIAHHRIMKERNPYKIKKLGNRVHNFNSEQWRKCAKQIAYQANWAKFSQNAVLKNILISNTTKIVECSTDTYWGAGLHLHDRNALKTPYWLNKTGGIMSEILSQVRRELQQTE